MGDEIGRHSGCSRTMLALALVGGVLVVCGFVIVGAGALLYFQVRSAERHALMERERALLAVERARQMAGLERDRAEAERKRAEELATRLQAEGLGETTIQIDREGNLNLGGEPIGLGDLPAALQTAAVRRVVIEADRQCPFEHVAKVLTLCRKCGIEDVEMRTDERAEAEQPP